MKILFLPIHYFLSDKYGSEPSWGVEMMNRLARRGHQVFAVAGRVELQDQLEPNIQLFVMDRSSRPKNTLLELCHKLRFYLYCYRIAQKILKQEKIDIIHHFAPISPNSFNLFFLLSRKDRPWIVGPAMPPPKSFSKKEFSQWLGTKDNLWARAGEILTRLGSPVFSFLTRRAFLKVDRLICVTPEAKNFYQAFVSETKIEVIPAGIDTQKFACLKSQNQAQSVTILTVAHLVKRKGVDILLKALKDLADGSRLRPKLIVVGDGPEKQNLRKLAEDLDLQEQVNFIGFVPHREIARYYREGDIFTSPTLYEPFGQTILEAMAAGLPVVASRVGGIPSMVDESTGILVEPGDVDGLAEVLEKLINDRGLREKMSQAARERAVEAFDWEKVVNRYEKVYQERFGRLRFNPRLRQIEPLLDGNH